MILLGLGVFGLSVYFDFWSTEGRLIKGKTVGSRKSRNIVHGNPQFKFDQKGTTNLNQYLKKQWALKDIDVLKAWAETEGRMDIVVAVCDTGIHVQHPCLKKSLWVNKGEIPGNKIDDDGNGYTDDVHGWNFVDNNPDIQDRHGHGTHISGIIAATGKTKAAAGCRMRGVAPRVKIMTLKYYDETGDNNVENTEKCINYAVQNGAHIINYSGGGPGENLGEKGSISKANDKGILFIAASGNESEEIEKQKYYPASYNLPNIISVNSKNPKGEILKSSNWVKMDWRKKEKIHNQTAPGERIYSTLPPKKYLYSQAFLPQVFRGLTGPLKNSDIWRKLSGQAKRSIPKVVFDWLSQRRIAESSVNHNTYGYMTGTSQATGIVTGVAALIKSRYPDWSHYQIISQINQTGYIGKAYNIKRKTNQGKVLNAHEALIMREKGVTFSDNKRPPIDQEDKVKGLKLDPDRSSLETPSNPFLEAQKILQKKKANSK